MTAPSPRSLAGGAAAHHTDAGRIPNPQGPPPPLPNGLPFLARDYRAGLGDTSDSGPMTPARTLRGGCYYVRYTPLQTSPTRPGAIHYLGTLRVHRVGATLTVSGDLYLRHVSAGSPDEAAREPDPADGIPVFPRADYRYYLRAIGVSDSPGTQESFTLTFELFRFNAAVTAWTNEGVSTVQLSWTTAPPGYPSGADYLTGDVRNSAGSVTGTLSLGWVSPFLRRSTVEIDRVPDGVVPRTNGSAGHGWEQVFAAVGWELTVIESDDTVVETSGESWDDAEMHTAMLEYRDRRHGLLDVEWRYHLLCVRLLDRSARGIMYDSAAADVNSTAREGVGIACDWVYEPDEPSWGDLRGKRFGDDEPTYFRTAVHELGHAMGLYHNASDNGFMNTTDVIARRARPGRPFPQNIRWAFHPDDEKRLRHMPDVWVRPGGVQFGEDYSVAPIAADDLVQRPEGLRLEVCPVEELLPFGAPARVDFTLVNGSTAPVLAPATLSLRGGDGAGEGDRPGRDGAYVPPARPVRGRAAPAPARAGRAGLPLGDHHARAPGRAVPQRRAAPHRRGGPVGRRRLTPWPHRLGHGPRDGGGDRRAGAGGVRDPVDPRHDARHRRGGRRRWRLPGDRAGGVGPDAGPPLRLARREAHAPGAPDGGRGAAPARARAARLRGRGREFRRAPPRRRGARPRPGAEPAARVRR